MYSGQQLNCNCKFIAIFILNRIGHGGDNCLSSMVSTSEEKSVCSKHRISFEDSYSCSIYCVDIKWKFHQQFVKKVRIQWTWEVALSPYLCQFQRICGFGMILEYSIYWCEWELSCISITDAWNDMEWNWSFRVNSIQNFATELVYAYLPTHMWNHVSHGSKVKYEAKKM